jgi:hypothetical protein
MSREQDVGWSNPRVLAIFAVIFLCGATFGAVGMRAFLHARMPFSDTRIIEAARAMPPQILAQRLNLTIEQRKAVMAQLDEYAKYYQNIEEERSDVARHGIGAIRQCLNEDQRRMFDRMFEAKR